MRFSRLPICASSVLCAPVVLAALTALTLPAGALSSTSNAIAVFRRNARTGHLTQGPGVTRCIAAQGAPGAGGCAIGVGLEGPNSVAVSPDGRNVYATSLNSNAIDVFARNRSTGALTQAAGTTCSIGAPQRVH